MGLYKRGKMWWIAYTVKGELVRQSTKQTNKKEAEKRWASVIDSLNTGTYVPEEQRHSILEAPPFEVAVESYLQVKSAQGKRLASYRFLAPLREDGRYKREKPQQRWTDAFGSRQVSTITAEAVEAQLNEWQEKHDWSNASRNNAVAQLSGFFSYCYARGWIDRHPTEKGRVPMYEVDNARRAWLRTKQLNEVIKHCPDWLKPIIRVAAATGMRKGELCRLTPDSYEEDNEGRAYLVTYETKNRKPLFWPLEGPVLTTVEQQLERVRFIGSKMLFPGPTGGSAYYQIDEHLRPAVEKAGLVWGRQKEGITFHSLRHTMASLAVNSGIPREVVQRMGNWKDPRMVDRYAKFSDETFREAAGKLHDLVGGATSHSFTPDQSAGEISKERQAELAASE